MSKVHQGRKASIPFRILCACGVFIFALGIAGDGSPARYLPGLGVTFVAVTGSQSTMVHHGTARPTAAEVYEDESFTDLHGRDAFHARYPVGASISCFYSRDDHNYVAVSNSASPLALLAASLPPALLASVVYGHAYASLCDGDDEANEGEGEEGEEGEEEMEGDDDASEGAKEVKGEREEVEREDDNEDATSKGANEVEVAVAVKDEREREEFESEDHDDDDDNAQLLAFMKQNIRLKQQLELLRQQVGVPAPMPTRVVLWLLTTCVLAGSFAAAAYTFTNQPYGNLRQASVLQDMVAAECNVTSHERIRWRSTNSGRVLRTMPGIGVTFRVKANDTGQGSTLWQSRARAHVLDHVAWMDDSAQTAFYERYPIGETITCFYSRKDPAFASVTDDDDGLLGVYVACVACVVQTFGYSVGLALWCWFLGQAHYGCIYN